MFIMFFPIPFLLTAAVAAEDKHSPGDCESIQHTEAGCPASLAPQRDVPCTHLLKYPLYVYK